MTQKPLNVDIDLDIYALYVHKDSNTPYFVKLEEISEKTKDEEKDETTYNCYPTVTDKTNNVVKLLEDSKSIEIPIKELEGIYLKINSRY